MYTSYLIELKEKICNIVVKCPYNNNNVYINMHRIGNIVYCTLLIIFGTFIHEHYNYICNIFKFFINIRQFTKIEKKQQQEQQKSYKKKLCSYIINLDNLAHVYILWYTKTKTQWYTQIKNLTSHKQQQRKQRQLQKHQNEQHSYRHQHRHKQGAMQATILHKQKKNVIAKYWMLSSVLNCILATCSLSLLTIVRIFTILVFLMHQITLVTYLLYGSQQLLVVIAQQQYQQQSQQINITHGIQWQQLQKPHHETILQNHAIVVANTNNINSNHSNTSNIMQGLTLALSIYSNYNIGNRQNFLSAEQNVHTLNANISEQHQVNIYNNINSNNSIGNISNVNNGKNNSNIYTSTLVNVISRDNLLKNYNENINNYNNHDGNISNNNNKVNMLQQIKKEFVKDIESANIVDGTHINGNVNENNNNNYKNKNYGTSVGAGTLNTVSSCNSCQQLREKAKLDNLESIKMHILRRLHLTQLPNITVPIQVPHNIIENFYKNYNANIVASSTKTANDGNKNNNKVKVSTIERRAVNINNEQQRKFNNNSNSGIVKKGAAIDIVSFDAINKQNKNHSSYYNNNNNNNRDNFHNGNEKKNIYNDSNNDNNKNNENKKNSNVSDELFYRAKQVDKLIVNDYNMTDDEFNDDESTEHNFNADYPNDYDSYLLMNGDRSATSYQNDRTTNNINVDHFNMDVQHSRNDDEAHFIELTNENVNIYNKHAKTEHLNVNKETDGNGELNDDGGNDNINDEYFSRVNSVYVFPIKSHLRHNHKSEILIFKFDNHSIISRVILHLYIRGREWIKEYDSHLYQHLQQDTGIFINIYRPVQHPTMHNYTHTVKLIEKPTEIPTGLGQWMQIELPLMPEWQILNRHINEGYNLIIRGQETWMHNLIVTNDSGFNKPLTVHIELITEHKRRHKRSTSLDCQESDHEVRCCRYPLKVNFTNFGWHFVVAPTSFDAYFCNGECKVGYLEHYTHTHIASLTTSAKPCCSPTKMSPLSLLYFNLDQNLVLSTIPNMSVEKCSCS